MDLHLRDVHLALRQPFTTAHGTLSSQHNLIVILSDGTHYGLGESPFSHAWPHLSPTTARQALEAAAPLISAASPDHPAQLWHLVQPALAHHPFALSALDQAAHDLCARRQGKALHQLLSPSPAPIPQTSHTIGLAPLTQMVAETTRLASWPLLKLKLGTPDDLAIVRELRRHTPAAFRIDANTAWSPEKTLALAPALSQLGVELIEQPLPKDDWHDMARLFPRCPLPLFADESCRDELDLARCPGHFHGINIKLSKVGGITPALRMITLARTLGLRIMLGCMCESSIGIAAAAQLLPLVDCADLDGALLLAQDIATGPEISLGQIHLSDLPGTGTHTDLLSHL